MAQHKMNKQKADMLCTAMVLGYALDTRRVFQYENEDDREGYEKVKDLFKRMNVVIDISQSRSKQTFPIIVAQTGHTSSSSSEEALDVEKNLSTYLERQYKQSSFQKDHKLFGAYIGGYSTVSTIQLLGASMLEQYAPTYRDADDSSVRKSYEAARKVSNEVIRFLTEVSKKHTDGMTINGTKISIVDLSKEIKEEYTKGHLFKSYHGMVLSMLRYSGTNDKLAFNLEIAFSKDTTKVSSCFPCTTFMEANQRPASSVHLGRGDNWNLPAKGSVQMRSEWEKIIRKWYDNGVNHLIKNNKASEDFLEFMGHFKNNVPDLFLTALTFEDPFTKRIINSIKNQH